MWEHSTVWVQHCVGKSLDPAICLPQPLRPTTTVVILLLLLLPASTPTGQPARAWKQHTHVATSPTLWHGHERGAAGHTAHVFVPQSQGKATACKPDPGGQRCQISFTAF